MKKIENFYVTGQAKDHEWIIDHREEFEEGVRNHMRDKGLMPVLDLPIKIVWEYDSDMVCHLKATAKGIKVGAEKAKKSMGYMSREGFIVSNNATEVSLLR